LKIKRPWSRVRPREYAAELGIAAEEALKRGMEEKPKEFVKNGAEVYAKA
jgi:phosphomethylpyrimidine synthase